MNELWATCPRSSLCWPVPQPNTGDDLNNVSPSLQQSSRVWNVSSGLSRSMCVCRPAKTTSMIGKSSAPSRIARRIPCLAISIAAIDATSEINPPREDDQNFQAEAQPEQKLSHARRGIDPRQQGHVIQKDLEELAAARAGIPDRSACQMRDHDHAAHAEDQLRDRPRRDPPRPELMH